MSNIISIYNNINTILKENPKEYIGEQFYKFIGAQFNNINLLYFNKNINLFDVLLEILDNLVDKSSNEFIKIIVDNTKELYDEISTLLITKDDIEMKCFINFKLTINKFINKNVKIHKVETSLIELSQYDDYKKMVTKYQYGTTVLEQSHRYIKDSKHSLSSKSLIRIMSELSSLKKDLPLHWDSSVIMRIIPTNMNLITFIITGPKDTPYHNGLFEFHAYFPDGYPNSVPKVLIHTTGNGKVRFNPNLYACGKVCLSLLGTWGGDKGESWIPQISTFFQVIISIQSLIFVDEPYFNEPGYQNSMGTERGIKSSKEYNDNIRYETVNVAMLDMLKNPPLSYEPFVKEYFKFKKTEIIDMVQKWVNESTSKPKFEKVFIELKNILEKL
jgi:hypothetical protein